MIRVVVVDDEALVRSGFELIPGAADGGFRLAVSIPRLGRPSRD